MSGWSCTKKLRAHFHPPTEENILTVFPQIPVFITRRNPGLNSVPHLKKRFWLFFRQFLSLVLRALSCQPRKPCRIDLPPKTCFVGKRLWKKVNWNFSYSSASMSGWSCTKQITGSFPSPNWRKHFDFFSANSCLYCTKKYRVYFHQTTEENILTFFQQTSAFIARKNVSFNSVNQLKKTFRLFFRQFLSKFLELYLASSESHLGMTGHQKQIL